MISRKDIRTWSILGMRGTLGTSLAALAEENDRICALTADLCVTSGLAKFRERFPERLYNVGIAEGNMLELAAGMADAGKIPFTTTFSNFAALRSCEQIRHFMSYMRCNVKCVGIGAGFAMELFGNTHYAVEDIAAIRAMPNLVILSPADGLELVYSVRAAAEYEGPVYLRIGGVMNHPIVYKEEFDFRIGKANLLKEGSEVVIIATGTMVSPSLKAAEKLEQENGISCTVLDMHTIAPLDREALRAQKDKKLFITVEEHRKDGGLGTAVAEALAEEGGYPKLLRLGVDADYKHAGTYTYMLEQNRLTPDLIAADVRQALGSQVE